MAQSEKANPPTHIILSPEKFQPPDGYIPGSVHHGREETFASTRTALHRGHRIEIVTTYRIEIDDEPLTLHTMVMDDGTVHCHGLPNYSFPSAIDLAKSIIDTAGLAKMDVDEIGAGNGDRHHDGGHHGSHNGHHGEDQ